jgi:hypothetical protein
MAKEPVPGKGYLNINKTKQGQQPDFKGHILLSRSYKEGDTFYFGAWNNNFGGFNLTESKPVNKQEYPRPVIRDDNEVPF